MRIRSIRSGRLHRLGCLPLAVLSLTIVASADASQHDSAQFPWVSAAYSYLPSADFATAGPDSTVKAKETQFAMGFFALEGEEFRFDAGFDYQYNHYAYQNIPSRNRDLHRLQIPIGFDWRNKGWSLGGFLAPGVATSSNVFKDLLSRASSEDFVVTGRLEAEIPRNPRFAWLGGVAYDRSFGEDKAYPVLGLLYRPDDSVSLRLSFPEISFVYALSGQQQLSLGLFPAGYSWHVVSDTLNDEFDYGLEAIRLQGSWSWRFADSWAVDLSAAYEFDRRHRFVDDIGRIIDSAVDSQVLVTVGIRWGHGPRPRSNRVARFYH